MIATPRESATVIVARDGVEGLEVYMVRRHHASGDFGGAFVFPGGLLDEADCTLIDACDGMRPEVAAARLALPSDRAIGHMVAAIRETFEEAGILLAWRDGAPIALEREGARWVTLRRQLLDGERAWGEIVAGEGLTLALGQLGYFAHWITPEAARSRFTTRFFVAELPEGQVPLPDAREVDHGAWVRPEAALVAHERGEMPMIFPTVRTLEELRVFGCAGELVAACEGREVIARLPRMVRRDGEMAIVLDHEA